MASCGECLGCRASVLFFAFRITVVLPTSGWGGVKEHAGIRSGPCQKEPAPALADGGPFRRAQAPDGHHSTPRHAAKRRAPGPRVGRKGAVPTQPCAGAGARFGVVQWRAGGGNRMGAWLARCPPHRWRRGAPTLAGVSCHGGVRLDLVPGIRREIR
ncbi:hypothetical protein CUR178_08286 [Leishmania enriettii]|uniref:Secreted protein n=1 Tax=Leishmania enriettii TaxID=5663 RepID=A0A836KQ95_LEIEN|nr:hypothetical protein CUR178_08286 [Leishmania enriettii]